MKHTCNVQYLAFFDIMIVSKRGVKKLSKGHMNDMFKQMEELFSKVDNLTKEVTIQKKEIKQLNGKLVQKDKQIEKLTDENQKMKTEIERLKNQNKKDSSNSNKPSGTNGFKKVITNRREKSNKKQGGQKRSGHCQGRPRREKTRAAFGGPACYFGVIRPRLCW